MSAYTLLINHHFNQCVWPTLLILNQNLQTSYFKTNLMFKSISCSLLLLAFSHFLYANKTIDEVIPCASIVVNSQTDITNLGISGCTMIAGHVTISTTNPADPITDLSDFMNIIEISGNLTITNNPTLQSLLGLQNITNIGGALTISDNMQLQSISNLSSLERVEQSIAITNNMSIKGNAINPALTFIGSDFNIEQNDSLVTLPSFPLLDTIMGDLIVEYNDELATVPDFAALIFAGGISVSFNPKITTIAGFNNVITCQGSLTVRTNPLMTSISGFQNLENQSGIIELVYNDELTYIEGFNEVDKISGNLLIQFNPQLNTFNAFSSLDSITGNCTLGLYDVSDFTAISEIEYVGNRLILENCNTITNTDILQNIVSVKVLRIEENPLLLSITEPSAAVSGIEEITISENNSLTTILPFATISSLNELTISANQSLTSVAGFSSLQSAAVLYIGEMSMLDFTGFSNLTSVDEMYFENNEMDDINGFPNLTNVEAFYIDNNPRIKTISGFNNPNLVISDRLDILGNDSLTAVTGFQNTQEINYLEIDNNPLLTDVFGFYNLTICEELNIFDNDNLEEYCPFFNLLSNDNNSLNYSSDGASDDEILEGGDCYRFEIENVQFLYLGEALEAAMPSDTIHYIPRSHEETFYVDIDDSLTIPVGIVLSLSSYLDLDFNETLVLEGTIINDEFSRVRTDGHLIIQGNFINKGDAIVTISENATLNGTVTNIDEARISSFLNTSETIIVNGTITNGVNATMDLENCTLNGTIENYGTLEFDD